MIMNARIRLALLLASLLMLTACSDNNNHEPNPYADAALWLCKPGAAANRCLELDQTLTNIYSTTSSAVIEHVPATEPEFDCFYVYPTVDFTEEPGNTEDLSDDTLMLRPLYNQAARFTEVCSLYAPLYRQMTIGTYGAAGGYQSTEFFATAFADVEAAFEQYLLESDGRPFVLLGHSQGSHMLIELLLKYFENDPELRARLVSALLIGPTGVLEVPAGEISGGTYENIPLCTSATDTSCIIAFDSIAGGRENIVATDNPIPCVNPTLLGGNPGVLENTIWEISSGMIFPAGVETPTFGYPQLHTANCESDGYLAIDTLTEEREPTASPQLVQLILASSNLHVADVNYALGDLLRIVVTQAENRP